MATFKAGRVSIPETPGAKTYEMMFILESGKQEKDRNELLSKMRGHIEEQGGFIQFEDLTWGDRMMMYRISGHDRGYYGVFVFDAVAKNVPNIEEAIRLENGVIRLLITTLPKNYKLVKFADAKEQYDIVANTSGSKIKVLPKKKAIKEQNLEEILSQEI